MLLKIKTSEDIFGGFIAYHRLTLFFWNGQTRKVKSPCSSYHRQLFSSKIYFSIEINPPNRYNHFYLHICHRLPIATICYILLRDIPALDFALIKLVGNYKSL